MPTETEAVEIKSPAEIGWMREAGAVVGATLGILSDAARAGVSTAELDRIAASELAKRKAKPAFLGYRGFPASLCCSINEEVVHGIPKSNRKLAEGDIIGLDFGCVVKGFYADAAVTVSVGKASPEARTLMQVAKEALYKGIDQARPGGRIGDISRAVQEHVEARGLSVVRAFVGHGIGRALHEPPAVPNFGRAGTGPRLAAGMVVAIEPMVNAGKPDVRVLADGWTAVTADGSLSAHFEHTVAITENGPEILTEHGGRNGK